MSVRTRLIISTSLALLALLMTFYIGNRIILVHTFHRVDQEIKASAPNLYRAVLNEKRQVTLDMQVVSQTNLLAAAEALRQNHRDFAVQATGTLMRLDLNLMALVAADGRLISSVYVSPVIKKERAVSASLQSYLTLPGLLAATTNRAQSLSTLILLDEGPILVSVKGVPGVSPDAPLAGVLIVGRHMQNPALLRRLSVSLPGLKVGQSSKRVQVRTDMKDAQSLKLASDIVPPTAGLEYWFYSSGGYVAQMPVYDAFGQQVVSLVVTMPRAFDALAESSLAWLAFFVALVGIVFITPLLTLQTQTVLDPLSRLAADIRILQAGDWSGRRLDWKRDDEFGVVAKAVDGMLDAIEQDHRNIRENEARNRALLEANPDILYLFDRDGRIQELKAPADAETLFHVAPAKAVGGLLADARTATPEVLAQFKEKIQGAFETGMIQSFEFHLSRPDGQDYWGEVRMLRMNERHVLAVERNVTDRCRAERGRRLLEVRIGQKQKMESLGILASGIAHDFNNILTAILGQAEAALANAPGASAEAISTIRSAAIRASGLTRQLQAYAGQGSFEIKRLSLNNLLGDMTQLLRSSLSKKAVVELRLDSELPMVEGDSSQLWQVAMNLLLNASEALDGQPGTITLSTTRMDATSAELTDFLSVQPLPAGTYVLLEVEDSGRGMTPDVLARIFDPFYSTKSKGRGLGLSAVMGIVQAHGGGIAVRSSPGAGTTFRIIIPACLTVEVITAAAPAAVATNNTQPSARKVVLVAEDENDIRKVVVLTLRSAGYEVIAAENGRVAVELFSKRADDISMALLDVEMPEMNGEEAFRAIHAIRPDVPIIVMTGYGDMSAHARFKDLQPAHILAKPFTRSHLLDAVSRVCQQAKSPTAG